MAVGRALELWVQKHSQQGPQKAWFDQRHWYGVQELAPRRPKCVLIEPEDPIITDDAKEDVHIEVNSLTHSQTHVREI